MCYTQLSFYRSHTDWHVVSLRVSTLIHVLVFQSLLTQSHISIKLKLAVVRALDEEYQFSMVHFEIHAFYKQHFYKQHQAEMSKKSSKS